MSRYFSHDYEGTYFYATAEAARKGALDALHTERLNLPDNGGTWNTDAVECICWGVVFEATEAVSLGQHPEDSEAEQVDYELLPIIDDPAVFRALRESRELLQHLSAGGKPDEEGVAHVLALLEKALGDEPPTTPRAA